MPKFPPRRAALAFLLVYQCLHGAMCLADIDTAKAAYEAGKFDRAFAEFRKASELGHAEAQFNFGAMYYKGQGTTASAAAALAWIRLAAEGGLPDTAKSIAAIAAEAGDAGKPVYEQLHKDFGKEALERTLLPPTGFLANDSVFADSAARDRVLSEVPGLRVGTTITGGGLNDPTLGVDRGIPGMSMLRAAFFVAPDGSVRGIESLFSMPREFLTHDWYQKAAQQRFSPLSPGAKTRARVLVLTLALGRDSQTLIEIKRQLAATLVPCLQRGSPACQYYAFLMQLKPADRGGESDESLLLKAAQGGYGPAQYLIGHRLAFGEARDVLKGRAWLEQALGNGQYRAAVTLARLEMESPAGANWTRARELLVQADTHKDPNATIPLAALYAACPDPCRRDSGAARNLLKRARSSFGETPTSLEITAAAAVADGDYKEAAKVQRRAIELAQRQNWDLAPLQERMSLYERNQAWYGDLLAF